MLIYQRALNAEVYANAQDQTTGYFSGEALQLAFGPAVLKGVGKVVKGATRVAKLEKGAILLKQALPNPKAFLASAQEVWKGGAQGTLSNAGRGLQKHAGRVGTAFSDIKFSGKTANQDAIKLIEEILGAKNQMIKEASQGGYYIYDKTTGRGISVSRNGLFNGFRNMRK